MKRTIGIAWNAAAWAVIAGLLVSMLWVASVRGQCGPGGCPTWRAPDVRVQAPGVDVRVKNRPTPAWRYERATGHREAVVRVICRDNVREKSIGSGVLVRWGRKLVVLTARHVIQDAKSILIQTFRKKTYKAKIVAYDALWDCAVLEIEGKPEIRPAEMEMGDSAMQRPGNRLESCGYGPDGQLAVNSGLFIGYRRSSLSPNQPPDDWFEISGRARGGDSGGPIFNERGRVVGVLWGTNGEVVVGVQAGRLHVLLDKAAPRVERKSYVQLAYEIDRRPTAPMPGPIMLDDLPDADVSQAAKGQSNPLLPWRGDAEARDGNLDARLRALTDALAAEREARIAGQQTPVAPLPPPVVELPEAPVYVPPEPEGPQPLVIVLLIVGALVVGAVVFYVVQKN